MRTTLEMNGDVASITLDDGKVNAMSTAMLDEICARLDETRERAHVTILAGRPGIFSAGFDMGAFQAGVEATIAMLGAGIRTIVRMLTHPHPIVVACTGHAYPAGAFLMMSADVRYGVRGPYRIGMNEVAIGLTVPRFALELAANRLTPLGMKGVGIGALFDPDEAVARGYMDRVVDEAALLDEAHAAATALLAIDRRAYRTTKARLNGPLVKTLHGLSEPSVLNAELEELAAGM